MSEATPTQRKPVQRTDGAFGGLRRHPPSLARVERILKKKLKPKT